jgi:hypothetical protein
MQDDSFYTNNFDAVLQAETAHIEGGENPVENQRKTGLAFSGGGIRSASFALGFMQALVSKDQLKKFDYLSTVSGGGYIGSALTWFLSQKIPPWMRSEGSKDEQYFSTSPKHFPFGQKCMGNRHVDRDHKPNAILDYIRQHGNYLIPGQGLNGMALMGYVLRALIVSFSVYTALLTVFMVAFYDGGAYQPIPRSWLPFGHQYFGANYFYFFATVLISIFFLASFLYSLFTQFSFGRETWKYQARTFVQRHTAWILSVSIFLIILGSVRFVHEVIASVSSHMRMPTAGGSALAGIIGALSQYWRLADGTTKVNSTVLIGAAALLIYGIALLAYYFGELIVLSQQPTWWLTTIMVLVMLVVSICVNVNFLGIHRMYRDRLMETFLPNMNMVRDNSWGLATDADAVTLDQMCQVNHRPYHLINTNIVLVDSKQSKYRGRGGDSFLLSPLYCGSDATGWVQSDKFKGGGSGKGISLPTAMAISGAALNPDAGVAGMGLTRGRIVSTLLSLLNLRLGFWASNPDPDNSMTFPPNFLSPGLKGGVLGGGLREDRRAIELSDGGHFENLAIYELLRRKMSVIVVTDGGADPDFNFSDLANAVEKARVDFGTTIVFNHPDYPLECLLPGSEEKDYFVSKYKGAKNPFAIASIYYNDGSEGTLVYVKTTLVKGLPADLIGYKTANPAFPDQSTTDQFFNECQFEAYRELGYCIGQILLEKNNDTHWF